MLRLLQAGAFLLTIFKKNKRGYNDMADIPKRYQDFTKDYPEIAKYYEELGSAVHNAGPLDDKTERQ
jgi:hypothetical protein